jgi:hypothetical protein
MSPLLYQLSYTARAAKLTTYGDRVKRGGRTLPGIVPVNHFASRILQIGRGDNVIAIEDRARSVPGDTHAHDFRHARTDQVSRGGAAEIMAQHAGQSHGLARARPTVSKVADALTLQAALREVWKEIGDDSRECSGQRPDSFDLFFQHPLHVGGQIDDPTFAGFAPARIDSHGAGAEIDLTQPQGQDL